ncbi:MAG: hypothetical protein JSV86_21310 [Gemmatimonadota bacterium]|nr:MAG: hypothetical protein JSV86_21310 [Gemmatimonadota bacterium]
MKISSVFDRGASGAREHLAGIAALDPLPRLPDTQLWAFVWCRCHRNHPALPEERAAVSQFPLLMVGLARNGGEAELSGNGQS